MTSHEEHTWNIDDQNSNQEVLEQRVDLRSRAQSLEDEGALAGDTDRIEDVEGIIPQPGPPRRHRVPRQGNGEEPVANNLRDTPSTDTAEVGIITQLGLVLHANNITAERREDAPHDQQSTGDLHSSGQERSAHEAHHAVEDFKEGEGLGRQQKLGRQVEDSWDAVGEEVFGE